MLKRYSFFVSVVAFLIFQTSLAQSKIVALIIGNNEYQEQGLKLQGAVHDAEIVAQSLRNAGIAEKDIIIGKDRTAKEILELSDRWAEKVSKDDFAILYYSGHGLTLQKAFIMGTDFKNREQGSVGNDEVSAGAVSVAKLIEKVAAKWNLPAKPKALILFLDACRSIPGDAESNLENIKLLETGIMKSIPGYRSVPGNATQGLAPGTIVQRKGPPTAVLYSTKPGLIALDLKEGGAFALSLAKHLGTRGISILDLSARIENDVKNATNGQTPSLEGGANEFKLQLFPGDAIPSFTRPQPTPVRQKPTYEREKPAPVKQSPAPRLAPPGEGVSLGGG